MRHYEIVFLVHPDQSDKVPEMIKKYEGMVSKVHRVEDWGRRQLAYPINKAFKAHYFVLNVECDEKQLEEFNTSVKFNDSIIRNLVLVKEEAVTAPSPMALHSKDSKTKTKCPEIIYSNLPLLRECTMETGRIIPARMTGKTAKEQRRITHAVKLARFLSLMRYCDRHQ